MSSAITTIWFVLLWFGQQGAATTGWKPIPPPQGIYLAKTTFPVRSGTSELSLLQDYRFDHQPEESSDLVEVFRKHQKYDTLPLVDDIIHPKESLKPFISALPIYDGERKRPPISYSFPPFKPKYIKPSKGSFLGKYHKVVGFTDSDISPYHTLPHNDRCPLYKVSFKQDLYFQYIQYKVHMPDLKEFTLCLWSKFHNHSYDHPLFSYAVPHQPKAIYMWVSNTERSNYYNMKINGHPIFRLNYPIRLNRWYHTCQSWNSKTGEWQVWVNAQRIGRGFHNLLVGHVIPKGGIAISGQEQLQYGGGFLEASEVPKGSGGLLGEIVMLQLYKIALSAGKAYTDHRHHHSHFTSTTPEPPEIPTEEPPPTPEHPFLENGQLKKPLKVFELAESLRTKGNLDTPQNQPTFTDFFDGHFVNPYLNHLTRSHYSALNIIPYTEHLIFKRHEASETVHGEDAGKGKFVTTPANKADMEKIQFMLGKEDKESEDWSETLHRTRRSLNETDYFLVDEDVIEPIEQERTGRGMVFRNPGYSFVDKRIRLDNRKRQFTRKESLEEANSDTKKVIAKKQVILGDVHFRPVIGHEFGYLHNSLPVLPASLNHLTESEKEPDDNPLHTSGEDIISRPQPEPAEDEVRNIMAVCSGCTRDPYRKVAVISWRSTPKKLYSGALFLKARSECRKF